MARRHFEHFEALSSAIPADAAYEAVIAVKRRDGDDDLHLFRVAGGRRFDLQSEAETAAEAALNKVREVGDDGELIWEEHAI